MASEMDAVMDTRTLREVVAAAAAAVAPVRESGALAIAMQQLGVATGKQAEVVVENTRAVLDNTIAQASGVRAAAGSAGRTAMGLMTAGLSPLLTGLARLFTGGDSHEPPPILPTYTKPAAVSVEGEVARDRTVEWRWPEAVAAERAVRAAPQVTVQVQAIDSRSFLDHKDEIARAVREAVLNSHSLVDALGEL